MIHACAFFCLPFLTLLLPRELLLLSSLIAARLQVLKKNGVFHVPYRGTMIGAALGGGRELSRNPLGPGETMDSRLEKKVCRGGVGVVRRGGAAWLPLFLLFRTPFVARCLSRLSDVVFLFFFWLWWCVGARASVFFRSAVGLVYVPRGRVVWPMV